MTASPAELRLMLIGVVRIGYHHGGPRQPADFGKRGGSTAAEHEIRRLQGAGHVADVLDRADSRRVLKPRIELSRACLVI